MFGSKAKAVEVKAEEALTPWGVSQPFHNTSLPLAPFCVRIFTWHFSIPTGMSSGDTLFIPKKALHYL